MYKTKRSPRKSNAVSRSGTSRGRFNKANGHKKSSQNGSNSSGRRRPGFAKHASQSEDNKPSGRRHSGFAKHSSRSEDGQPAWRKRGSFARRDKRSADIMPEAGSQPKSDRGSSAGASPRKLSGHKRSFNFSSDRPDRRRRQEAPRRDNKRRFSKPQRGNKTIDIAHIVRQSANAPAPKAHIIKHTFADFNFIPELQNNLDTIEFVTPTPIQDLAIPHVIDGKDVVGVANTGTGKTGVFLLPLIDRIARDRTHKVLIITPTRELASQIDGEHRKFSKGMRILSSECIGGVPLYRQLDILKRHPSIVIGTPGRLKDLRDRGALKLDSFNTIVLDEVDRMLDMGFIDIVRNLLSQVPDQRQSLFFSATIPPVISKLIQQFLNDPVTFEISSGQAAHNVEQDVIRITDHKMKFETLKELLAQPGFEKVLIFSETKRDVEKLTKNLYQTGFKVDSIHGDKRQSQRQKSLSRFRDNRIKILVATDVAARGLDIKDVTHVINYTIPQSYDDYIHRIGRTGRGSSKGIALTFI